MEGGLAHGATGEGTGTNSAAVGDVQGTEGAIDAGFHPIQLFTVWLEIMPDSRPFVTLFSP